MYPIESLEFSLNTLEADYEDSYQLLQIVYQANLRALKADYEVKCAERRAKCAAEFAKQSTGRMPPVDYRVEACAYGANFNAMQARHHAALSALTPYYNALRDTHA